VRCSTNRWSAGIVRVVVSIVPTSYGIDVLKRRRRRSHRR